MESVENAIRAMVHRSYFEEDKNCACTTLMILSKLFETKVEEQTMQAAVGLHGAGGYRAQCGLVEGTLLFLGVCFVPREGERRAVELCRRFAEAFEREFSSLRCYELRPGGFREDDPPHACEELTARAVIFAYRFVEAALKETAESKKEEV